MKVLVLGSNGMLGHMVTKYLKYKKIDVSLFVGRWPKDKEFLSTWKGDYIINCIGAIPQRTKDFSVNWELPIWLDKNMDCRIIHPGTDCEIDQDPYGISKQKAAEYIKTKSMKTKSLKTSIIGPEYETSASLLQWFLNTNDEIQGWSEHYWNGNTTLTWAEYCLDMMLNWNNYDKETILGTECISKYELLKIIKKIFEKDAEINPVDNIKANKCLTPDIQTESIEKQLLKLKGWYYDN